MQPPASARTFEGGGLSDAEGFCCFWLPSYLEKFSVECVVLLGSKAWSCFFNVGLGKKRRAWRSVECVAFFVAVIVSVPVRKGQEGLS